MSTSNECVIYDENNYYGDYYAYGNEDGAWQSWQEDLADFGETPKVEEFDAYVDACRSNDFERTLAELTDYFDGKLSEAPNPHSYNALIARGTLGRWDGERSGMTEYKDLDDLLYGRESVFKNCTISKVWDEDGHLHINGYHHDGSVSVEVKQLTDAGEAVLHEWEFTPSDMTFEAAGKQYPAGQKGEAAFMQDFWDNPDFCVTPNYAEKVYGFVRSEPAPRMVETSIGTMPVEDYREIVATQSGFDSYADMYKQGYRLGNGYDVAPEEALAHSDLEQAEDEWER